MMFLLCLLCCFNFSLGAVSVEERLQEANASYQKGENASTFEERKQAFNRSLSLFSSLEQERIPTLDEALLDEALADNYFHLEEYVWAILYYQRALKNNPHSSDLIASLEKAQKKQGLPPHFSLTFNQRFFTLFQHPQGLFWVILITFLICSSWIWFSYAWLHQMAISCLFFLFLLGGCYLFSYYSFPLEGILVQSTGFYRLPDENQPQLTHYPLLAGSKVTILQMTSEGNWTEIATSDGLIGYIPTAYLRAI